MNIDGTTRDLLIDLKPFRDAYYELKEIAQSKNCYIDTLTLTTDDSGIAYTYDELTEKYVEFIGIKGTSYAMGLKDLDGLCEIVQIVEG